MVRKLRTTTVIDKRMYNIKTARLWQTIYRWFELTHTRVCPNTHIRVTGNILIRVFIITLIWVLKAVSNKQERTALYS